MPKNSRRKKQTRQHAVRKRERYMRALRSQATASRDGLCEPPAAADPANPTARSVKHVSTGAERVLPVQRMLESRGWIPLPYSGRYFVTDAQWGFASIADTWEFAAAFGGAELEDEEDVAPQKPTLGFGGGIWVDTAGNWGGCAQHRSIQLDWPFTERGVAQLPELLSRVEDISRTLDARPFIECLADGPCAKLAEQRWGPNDPLD